MPRFIEWAVPACAFSIIVASAAPALGGDPRDYYSDEKSIALINAVDKEDLAEIDRLIKSGVNPDTKGHSDKFADTTPLFWAYAYGRKRAFERLLVDGADPHYNLTAPLIGGSVMNYVAQDKEPEWLELILKHKGDPNRALDERGRTPLFYAVYGENTKTIELLVAAGADINHRGYAGTTPLLETPADRYEPAYCLLKLGADYTVKDTGLVPEDFAWRLFQVPSEDDPEWKWYNKVIDFLEERKFDFGPDLKRAETECPELVPEWKKFMAARAAKKTGN